MPPRPTAPATGRSPARTSGTGRTSTSGRTARRTSDGAVWAALREAVPWEGRDVLDVGCGDGFHLPLFTGAASVTGVEPHAPLVARARTRLAGRPGIRVLAGRRRGAPAAGRVGGPRARPHRLLLRPRAASRALPRRSGSCGPAGRSRSSTSTRPCPLRRLDACRPAPLRPRRRRGVLRRPGLHAAPDPDGLALPGPGDPRRRAAHRVQPRRRRARDRRHPRARDPRRIPAARAPPPSPHPRDQRRPWRSTGLPPRRCDQAGTVGGPGRRRWDGRAQAGRGSGIGGAGPRGRCRLAVGLGGPAERNGHGRARRSASRSPCG